MLVFVKEDRMLVVRADDVEDGRIYKPHRVIGQWRKNRLIKIANHVRFAIELLAIAGLTPDGKNTYAVNIELVGQQPTMAEFEAVLEVGQLPAFALESSLLHSHGIGRAVNLMFNRAATLYVDVEVNNKHVVPPRENVNLIFEVRAGQYHSTARLPIVSTGDQDVLVID
jgi:hypothetical protein